MENPIQGLITYCKKSQLLASVRKSASDAEFRFLSSVAPRPAAAPGRHRKRSACGRGEPRKRSACRGGRRNRNEVFFLSGDKWGNFLSNMTKKLKMSNCEALILLLYKNCEIRINFIFF
jgi:hypothetical protein